MLSGIAANIEAKFAIPLLILGFLVQLLGGIFEGTLNVNVVHTYFWISATFVFSVIVDFVIWKVCFTNISSWNTDLQLMNDIDVAMSTPNPDVLNRATIRANIIRITNETDNELLKRCKDVIMKQRNLMEM
jgi:hypothetical protein